MSDKTPETSQEQTPEKPTLESLYEEFKPQEAPQEQPKAIPAAKPASGNDTAILHEIQTLKAELASEKQERQRAQEEKDLKAAVAQLAKTSGLNGKDVALKGYLIGRASEDERLRAMWEKRNDAPQAWDQALGVLAEDAKAQFVITDPQLEENQRAMEDSQRSKTASAPQPTQLEQQFQKMNDGEFEQQWQRLLRGM